MDHNKYEENGGAAASPPPHFLDIGYGPSVACTVGCTWLMYSLHTYCAAHNWMLLCCMSMGMRSQARSVVKRARAQFAVNRAQAGAP